MNDGLTEEQIFIIDEVKAQLPIVLTLSNPDKSRCLLGLSYEYFLMDLEEEAYKLLKQADPAYFGEQLGKDMKEIPNMDIVVFTITSKLIELGLVLEDIIDFKPVTTKLSGKDD